MSGDAPAVAAPQESSPAPSAAKATASSKQTGRGLFYSDLEALRAYRDYSNREVDRVRRNLVGLSEDDQASLVCPKEEQVKKMEDGVRCNLAFLDKVAELIRQGQAKMAADEIQAVLQATTSSQKSVQTLLQSFVREWSKEGLEERATCFEKLLGALDKHLGTECAAASSSGAAGPRVLCPGSELGRLPFEVASRGYTCEACEGRPLNFFGSEFVRQHCAEQEGHQIQPFVLNTCNRWRMGDHVRVIPIPEVNVSATPLPPVQLGEFIRIYDTAAARASFDAVLTAFALDTSVNVFRYIRTVAHVVREGGIWTNFGPLAYDTDHDEEHGHCVELSWEELKYAIGHFFEIREEEFVDAFHAANGKSMMQIKYSCIYFSAVRTGAPAPGIGQS